MVCCADVKFWNCAGAGNHEHDLAHKHIVVKMTPEDLIDVHLPRTIETLKVWDGMTIRNSLVISAA